MSCNLIPNKTYRVEVWLILQLLGCYRARIVLLQSILFYFIPLNGVDLNLHVMWSGLHLLLDNVSDWHRKLPLTYSLCMAIFTSKLWLNVKWPGWCSTSSGLLQSTIFYVISLIQVDLNLNVIRRGLCVVFSQIVKLTSNKTFSNFQGYTNARSEVMGTCAMTEVL